MPPTDQPVRLEAAPGGVSHWKVYRGETWLGWVHRFGSSGHSWRAKPADGLPLSEHFSRRRDAIEALLATIRTHEQQAAREED